jgi:hypothetical protein
MVRTLRLIVCWFFLAEAILCIGWTLWSTWSLLYTRDTTGDYALVFTAIALTGVFGLAAWALRKEQSARKGWVIAAAGLNLLLSIAPTLPYAWLRLQGFLLRPGVFSHLNRSGILPLVLGITALFVLPREQSAAKATHASPS